MSSQPPTAPEQPILGLTAGSLINDRYEVRKVLGIGGFAAVFQAFDRQIERNVAIKVLNIDALSGQGADVHAILERFRREATLAARIRHPSVVQIFDFGVLKDQAHPFIIMEMLQGHDLDHELAEKGGMLPQRALPLFCDALDALGEAHRMGIVHKDLKPANLFLNEPGARRESLKLVDFGIAHIGGNNQSRLTQTGYMLGSPQYMAPEYVEAQTVSPALDVYQMGLILVELLTGRAVLFDENPWKCAMMHISRDLSIPVKMLDTPLGPILKKALALAHQERFEDANAFADALRTVNPQSLPAFNVPGLLMCAIDTHVAPAPGAAAPQAGLAQQPAAGPMAALGQSPAFDGERTSITSIPMAGRADSSSELMAQRVKLQTAMRASAGPQMDHTMEASAFVEEAPASRKFAILGGVFALLVVVALVVVMDISGGEDPQTPMASEAAPSAPAPAALAPAQAAPAAPAAPTKPQRVVVRVVSEPDKATLLRDGVDLGTTPFVLDFDDAQSAPVEVMVRLEGYQESKALIAPKDAPVRLIKLAELPKAPAPEAPKPAPKPARPSVSKPSSKSGGSGGGMMLAP